MHLWQLCCLRVISLAERCHILQKLGKTKNIIANSKIKSGYDVIFAICTIMMSPWLSTFRNAFIITKLPEVTVVFVHVTTQSLWILKLLLYIANILRHIDTYIFLSNHYLIVHLDLFSVSIISKCLPLIIQWQWLLEFVASFPIYCLYQYLYIIIRNYIKIIEMLYLYKREIYQLQWV